MKPAPFDYVAPTSLDEAVSTMQQLGMDAKVLAGGQSLMPVLAMRLSRFEYLVDLNQVSELAFVTSDAESVTIGAMTREATVGSDPTVARLAPLLAQATKHIGHFQIRNRGTLGGSIAHADPSAEYPAVAIALADATMNVAGPNGIREVRAADFFAGSMMSTLDDEEILQSVRFPTWGGDSRFAVREFARRAGDFATAGVAAGVQFSDGVISRVAIGFFGMGSTPTRAHDVEAELIGQPVADLDLVAVGHQAVLGLEPPGDIHATTALRLRIGADLVRIALADCIEGKQ